MAGEMKIPEPPADAPAIRLNPKDLALILSYPSVLVPVECRHALFQCWYCHRTLEGLQKDSGPIAALLSVWINDDGLEPADATAILLRQQRLSTFGGLSFGNQLLTRIAEHCREAVATRKKEREDAERRREQQATADNRVSPEEMKKFREQLSTFGIEVQPKETGRG